MRHPIFETNDDMGIIGILSGKYGEPAYPDGTFIALPLSSLIYLLYKISVHVPWYSITLYALQWASLSLAFLVIIKISFGLMEKIFLILGFVGIYSFMFYRLNFTSVSLLLWFSVSIYFAYLNLSQKPPKIWEIGLGVLLGLSYMIRPSTFNISIIFSLPLFATFIVSGMRKRLVYVVVPLLCIVVFSVVMSSFWQSGSDYQNFQDLNQARSNMMDTGQGDSNLRTPEALKKAGWSVEDYQIARLWWFHDSNIFSTKKINTFLENNKGAEADLVSIDRGVKAIADSLPYLIIIPLALPLFAIVRIRELRPYPKGVMTLRGLCLLSLVAIVAGIFILACVRFPGRIFIPLYLYLFLVLLIIRAAFPNTSNLFRPVKIILLIAGCALFVYIMQNNLVILAKSETELRLDQLSTEKSFAAAKQTNGQDTVFVSLMIHTATEAASPFQEYNGMLNYHRLPEGWLIRTPFYYETLNQFKFPREDLVPSLINNQKVLFSYYEFPGYEFSEYRGIFERHLRQHYASRFPGKTIQVENVLNKSHPVSHIGWVFFRVVAK